MSVFDYIKHAILPTLASHDEWRSTDLGTIVHRLAKEKAIKEGRKRFMGELLDPFGRNIKEVQS